MPARNYQDLIVWQRAMDLVEGVYRLTASFPKSEIYGLCSQMRRASVSIPSNIAEGQGRGGDPEFVRFLRISYGSVRELETQLIIAQRLEYADAADVHRLLETAAEVGKLLNGLMNSKA